MSYMIYTFRNTEERRGIYFMKIKVMRPYDIRQNHTLDLLIFVVSCFCLYLNIAFIAQCQMHLWDHVPCFLISGFFEH